MSMLPFQHLFFTIQTLKNLCCDSIKQMSLIPLQPPPAPPVQRCLVCPRSRQALRFGSGLCGEQPAGRLRKVLSAACHCRGLVLSDQGNSGHTRRSQSGWNHPMPHGQWDGSQWLQSLWSSAQADSPTGRPLGPSGPHSPGCGWPPWVLVWRF